MQHYTFIHFANGLTKWNRSTANTFGLDIRDVFEALPMRSKIVSTNGNRALNSWQKMNTCMTTDSF
jgi:hypothetical protein